MSSENELRLTLARSIATLTNDVGVSSDTSRARSADVLMQLKATIEELSHNHPAAIRDTIADSLDTLSHSHNLPSEARECLARLAHAAAEAFARSSCQADIHAAWDLLDVLCRLPGDESAWELLTTLVDYTVLTSETWRYDHALLMAGTALVDFTSAPLQAARLATHTAQLLRSLSYLTGDVAQLAMALEVCAMASRAGDLEVEDTGRYCS
jgi:hypothetical protein